MLLAAEKIQYDQCQRPETLLTLYFKLPFEKSRGITN